MPLNILRFEYQGRIHWGVVRAGRISPIPTELFSTASTADLIRNMDMRNLAEIKGNEIDEAEVTILSPITRDRQFICQGANYRQHMIESGIDPDTKNFNMIFTKASSCIVSAISDVVRPVGVEFLDYEIELGLVMRRDITARCEITSANLHEYVAGMVIVNDYSARDIQIPQTQFYKGKSFRTFGPVGPYLCLLDQDDMASINDLDLRLTVNGEVRQQNNTKNLIYGPAETLTELSGVQDLFAGDLLSTGTPAGCALRLPATTRQQIATLPGQTKRDIFRQSQAQCTGYLKPGDIVEASIKSGDGRIDLGRQRNRVVAE